MSQNFIFLHNDNIDEFYYIFNDAFKDDVLNRSIDLELFKENLITLNIKNEISFLLKDNGKPVGLFLASMRGNRGYISSIAVIKNFRKMGYGQILLEKGISLMEEYNCKKIKLEVIDDNKNAINLYLKTGFKISNTILNFKYEGSLIYSDKIDPAYSLNNSNSFTYQLLYNTFHKTGLPWQKSLKIIYDKIENKKTEVLILHFNNTTAGYIVVTTIKNSIIIEDIGLKDYSASTVNTILSMMIAKKYDSSSQNKINLFANNYYQNDPLCIPLQNMGFNTYIKQLEMEKKII
jgi:ribosomal protein S18 acetylase RimI-like enzyme